MGNFTPTSEQSRIIDAPSNSSILVVAGAGSGKTFTMTQRIIALINNGVQAEKILGLTFTRKAAGELLSRVSKAVIENKRNEQDKQSSLGSQIDANSMFMKPEVYTYDAFFQNIVRQYGLLVGFDPNTQPLSNAGATQLATQVVEDSVSYLLSNGLKASDISIDTFSKNVLALSSAISNSMIGTGCSDFVEATKKIQEWDSDFIVHLEKIVTTDSYGIQLDKLSDLPLSYEKKDNLDAAKKFLKKDDPREREKSYKEWVNRDKNRKHKLSAIGVLLSATKKRNIYVELVSRYYQAKQETNLAEFSDFTIAAYQLVTRFPWIGSEYRRRFSHVFLDEYQDTSTTQAMVLVALFHPKQSSLEQDFPEQEAATAVTAVGDPYQAIYAWRGASPGAFRLFKEDYDYAADALTLSQTRRNPHIVLDAANFLTEPLRMSVPDPLNRRTSAEESEVSVPQLTGIEETGTGSLGLLGYETLPQEVDGVVRFVKQALKRYASSEDKTDETHVAVLFRSKKNIPTYREALEEAGITCETVGISDFMNRPDVLDVTALLKVLVDHSDSATLMRLLASPRFGLSPSDLRLFARYADDLNEIYQIHFLAESGILNNIAESGIEELERNPKKRKEIIHSHRGDVPQGLPIGIYLVDALLKDNLTEQLTHTRITEIGQKQLVKAAHVVQSVERVIDHPLSDVIRTAGAALGLDIDTQLAHTLASARNPHETVRTQSCIDTLISLSQSYISELQEQLTPTISGFMAWLSKASDDASDPIVIADSHAQVILMTIHQAKGLEWDAVAIVGMSRKGFPSTRETQFLAKPSEDLSVNPQKSPQYFAESSTWLEDSCAVPAPLRVDSQILPKFPHTGNLDILQTIDDVEIEVLDWLVTIDDEPRARDFLSQHSEYGQRLFADERRLAYVALTRAKHEALLTFSVQQKEDNAASASSTNTSTTSNASSKATVFKPVRFSRDDNENIKEVDVDKDASFFWQELYQHYLSGGSIARASAQRLSVSVSLDNSSPDAPHFIAPVGFFIGENADDLLHDVVEQALVDARDSLIVSENENTVWPKDLKYNIGTILRDSADAVRNAESKYDDFSDAKTPLLERAHKVIENLHSQPKNGSYNSESIDTRNELIAKAARILDSSMNSVTAMQSRITLASKASEGSVKGSAENSAKDSSDASFAIARSVLRPIPQVASLQAQKGTIFHAWAEEYLGIDEFSVRNPDISDDDPQDLREWKKRLMESQWAQKYRVYSVEQPIVVDLWGRIIKGKLDAIFEGSLANPQNVDCLTIVDWKTGRRPQNKDEEAAKLIQLDVYRLLLSEFLGRPIESIDAALYYVSEENESRRLIPAEPKSRHDIEEELSAAFEKNSSVAFGDDNE